MGGSFRLAASKKLVCQDPSNTKQDKIRPIDKIAQERKFLRVSHEREISFLEGGESLEVLVIFSTALIAHKFS